MKNKLHMNPSKNALLFKQAINSTCKRCSGSGYLLQYRHIENGICFQCRGAGFNRFDFKN